MKHLASVLAAMTMLASCSSLTDAPEKAADVLGMPRPAEADGATKAAALPQSAPASVSEEVETKRLNAFFEEIFEAELLHSPIALTYQGRRERYNEWNDASDTAAIARFERGQASLKRMKSEFEFDSLSPDGQISWQLFEYAAKQEAAAHPFRKHGYVFNQMFGQQSAIPAFLINQHKVQSVSDAEDYVSRLEGVRGYLGQHVANARERALLGVRPPRFVYDYVISDARNVITGAPFDDGDDSPLFDDFKKKVNALDISDDEKAKLIIQAHDALLSSVLPAYEELSAWLVSDKSKAGDDDGVWRLPLGEAYYDVMLRQRTTTELSAKEIHALGLLEVDRIHSEMRDIMEQVGFDGSLQDFFEFMRTDPRFYYPSSDEGRERYLTEATTLIDDMKTRLPSMFDTLPKADLIVKRVEPFREKSAGKAFYERPAPDGSRPGTYYANLYNMEDMPTYQMAALAFHEGVPGHHLQLAIAQELPDVPRFRRFGGHTAYLEGWGLYSEYLGKEMGFYQDPYSDFGRLAMELWRAARLVVDTGLHDKRWSREEAIQYLIDNTPNPEGDCRKAIDRYIVMPGQATAYKIGMIKILELRADAMAKLGKDFDMGGFHDAVLAKGSVPLGLLEELVDAWVAEKQRS